MLSRKWGRRQSRQHGTSARIDVAHESGGGYSPVMREPPFRPSPQQTPNPSIEGTSNIWLRQLLAAPHVKQMRQVVERSPLVTQRHLACSPGDVALVRQCCWAPPNGSAPATSQCGEPSAYIVDARSERHGAEAPRKSNSGLSRFCQSRIGERSGRARQLCHLTRRRIQVRVVTLAAKMVHSGTTSNASEYKCGNSRGSVSVAFRMQAP